MNVYEEAHNLKRAIEESEEYRQFHEMQKVIDQDPGTAKMVQAFQQLQMKMQAKQMMGEGPDQEMMQQLQQLSAVLMTNPQAAQYLQNAMRFTLMMSEVVKIIGETVDIGNLMKI